MSTGTDNGGLGPAASPSPRGRKAEAAKGAADAATNKKGSGGTALMRQYHVPGAGLGVSIDGRTTLRGFGVTSLDGPRPVSDGSRPSVLVE